MRFGIGLALLALMVAPSAGQDSNAVNTPHPEAVQLSTVLDLFVLPAMMRFRSGARAMPVAMQALCDTPSETALENARLAFTETVLSFSAIEFIRTGPIMENNRSERILFWPDRKGIALRQVQGVLAESDETATNPETLSGKSVAVQGLTALEFLLYGTGSETLLAAEGDFRCRYGVAIGENVAGLAQEITAGWQDPEGITKRLLHPSAEYADYRTHLEALEATVGLVTHGLEAIRDTRLTPFIASDTAAAKPRLALFWRSGLTIPALRANMEGMQNLLAGLNVEDGLSGSNLGLPASIDFEFRNAHRAIGLITDAPEAAVADAKQAQALNYLSIVLRSLQTTVGENLSQALGLSVGFSSLDGD